MDYVESEPKSNTKVGSPRRFRIAQEGIDLSPARRAFLVWYSVCGEDVRSFAKSNFSIRQRAASDPINGCKIGKDL